MPNVNDHNLGRSVTIRSDARGNYLAADFPGWGAEDYADHLVPTSSAAGTTGKVISVNSHGSNPWTRYSIRMHDGGHLVDGVPGDDFDWTPAPTAGN
jgi:hypothetical protein